MHRTERHLTPEQPHLGMGTLPHGFPWPDETTMHAGPNKKQMSHALNDGFNTIIHTNPICTANTRPQTILLNALPHNHIYIRPTPSTHETSLPKTNNTPNTHPHKPWQLDTTADFEVPDIVVSTQPTPNIAVPGMQWLHYTPRIRL